LLESEVHSVAWSWGDLHIFIPEREDLKSIKCKTTAVSKEIHGNTAETVGFFTNPLTAAMTRTRSARITAMRVSRELWSSRSFRSVSKTSSYSKALELVRCILYRTAKCKTKRLMEIDMITPILSKSS